MLKKILSGVIAAFLVFCIPISSNAWEGSFVSGSIQAQFDNDYIVDGTLYNGSSTPLSPGIYSRMDVITTNVVFNVSGNAGDIVHVTADVEGYFTRFFHEITIYKSGVVNFQTSYTGNSYDITFELLSDVNNETITISSRLSNFSWDESYADSKAAFGWDIDFEINSASNTLLDSIKQWLQNIFDDLQQLPNKIGNFFSNLISNLQNLFSDVGNWFIELGTKIGDFFSNLGDSISDFFEKLWNRIYWGNENGEAEYQPPVFSSSISDALDKINGYVDDLQKTYNDIDSAQTSTLNYIQRGTNIINSVLGVFPSMATAAIIFGIVFIFCRKVIGR